MEDGAGFMGVVFVLACIGDLVIDGPHQLFFDLGLFFVIMLLVGAWSE